MAKMRVFAFADHNEWHDRPFALVQVPETGDIPTDIKTAYKRFRLLYGWDPTTAVCSAPNCGESTLFVWAVNPGEDVSELICSVLQYELEHLRAFEEMLPALAEDILRKARHEHEQLLRLAENLTEALRVLSYNYRAPTCE